MPRAPPEERAWPLDSLTFVLQLRRAGCRPFFTATAQPQSTRLPGSPWLGDVVGPVTFVGAFVPGVAPRFDKLDTASLFVERMGAKRVACLFLDLPRQRILRFGQLYGDEDASDFGSHTSDEELDDPDDEEDDATTALHWQPQVTRFESRTLFFVTTHDGLPPVFHEIPEIPGTDIFGCFFRNDTVCTLSCAIEGAEGAAAVVKATLGFRRGLPRVSEDYGGGGSNPLTALQLTGLLQQLEWR